MIGVMGRFQNYRETSMSELVFARSGQALTTSAILAQGANAQHRAVLQLIRKYPDDFNGFGKVAFETQTFETAGGEQVRQVAVLNEQHAMLLMTYFKNTEVVRKFKVALVKAFFEMRERLHPTCPVAATQTIDAAQQLAIRNAVAHRAKTTSAHYRTIYNALYDAFQVPRYTELKAADFDDAIRFIEAYALPQLAAPAERRIVLTESEAQHFLSVAYQLKYLFREPYKKFFAFLNAVNSPMSGTFWDAFNDMSVDLMARALERNGLRIEDLDCYRHWAMKH